jgi:hypothetical protein
MATRIAVFTDGTGIRLIGTILMGTLVVRARIRPAAVYATALD